MREDAEQSKVEKADLSSRHGGLGQRSAEGLGAGWEVEECTGWR